MKQSLSVVLATYNEEKTIAQCLNAVKDWADEIVVVDGSSTDKTQEIVQQYTKNLIRTDNKPMFHINKNMAIDAATSDWVLQLDADEIVSDDLKKEIDEVINGDPKENGFWVPRLNYFLGHYLRKGGVYPDPTIRLYRRGTAKLPCRDVHEQAEVQGTVGTLKHDLLHYDSPSFSRYLSRWNRYTTLSGQDILDGKEKLAHPVLLQYFFIKPIWTFMLMFFRHKGFEDGFPGFVFALFSGLRFMAIYIKYWERQQKVDNYLDPIKWQ